MKNPKYSKEDVDGLMELGFSYDETCDEFNKHHSEYSEQIYLQESENSQGQFIHLTTFPRQEDIKETYPSMKELIDALM